MPERSSKRDTSNRQVKGKRQAKSHVAAPGQLPLLPLHTLGWKGFQDLIGTILREVLGQTYGIWSPTADGGRDGTFVGSWRPGSRDTLVGEFVVQCKHTSTPDTPLTLSIVAKEFAKVRALAETGRADIYLLFTNHRLTGKVERAIKQKLRKRGIKQAKVFGDHWISAQVYESSRLRALVPRVYGIGDLGEILDERAYGQAQAVLESLEDEIRTFVPVEAYRKACDVLSAHGFVCLIGEPGCGKSTIAAMLILMAADRWKVPPVRLHSPEHFDKHWAAGRREQVFWIDDAFGETQYEHSKSMDWRRRSRDLRAAVRAGARFVMTSRDYIFRRALSDFRKEDLPVADMSQIEITVEALSIAEKEAILYNHMKMGPQPKAFLRAIKGHLPRVAQRAHMLPEVAKRLANPFFTRSLTLTAEGLTRFAEDPGQYLLEVLKGLEKADRAAMILLFSRGGKLSSPIPDDPGIKRLLEIAGATLSELKDSLKALRNTLVRLVVALEESYWTYRHPTIHDAISIFVSEDSELVGIYLRTSDVEQILSEVYFAGAPRPQGAHIAVPRHLYGELAARIIGAYGDKQRLPDAVLGFLTSRADDDFLRQYALASSRLQSQLFPFWSYRVGEFSLLERLHAVGLFTAPVKRRIIEHIKLLANEHEPNADWLDSPMFSVEDRVELLAHIRTELVSDADFCVDRIEDEYDSTEDPEDCFESLVDALETYRDAFQEVGDSVTTTELDKVLCRISDVILELEEKNNATSQPPDDIRMPRLVADSMTSEASRFDDLDE